MIDVRVRIQITPSSVGSRIFVDDVEIHGVRAIHVTGEVGSASRVTLELIAASVRIDGVVGEIFTGGPIREGGGP